MKEKRVGKEKDKKLGKKNYFNEYYEVWTRRKTKLDLVFQTPRKIKSQ